jgi:ABC-2 type transport system permease protein
VLLLQHLSLTFGALSIVREYQLGAAELFYVAPLSSLETLLGKYLSYLIFGVALTVILSLILIYVLQVPMLGSWYHYSLVMAALIFASIGIGFTLSVLSQTDSQAVQYSMIVLLTSVFFSGFFLSIESLWEPVRAVSWMLPATYAIILLQNIMLRGYLSSVFLLAVLLAIGVFFFFLSLLLMNLKMARR